MGDLPFIFKMQKQQWHRLFCKKNNYDKNDLIIKEVFKDENKPFVDKFDELVHYFWEAHAHYMHKTNTFAYYPGYSSIYGAKNDAIEGVVRLLPLWASYVTSSRQKNKYQEAIKYHLKIALLNGTNRESSGYWGDIKDKSTLICESADIALSIWLIRDSLWLDFTEQQQSSILQWLKQVVGKKTADNNWHLFVVLVDLIIESLDKKHNFQSLSQYDRVKSFYIGDGCFKDGENGQVDFYNAWAFHYSFFWIKQIKPDFDRLFLDKVLGEYVEWYQYLFTENGFPLFGRSLCYRMAAPVPLLAILELNDKVIYSGEALEALISCWSFFIKNDALKNGCSTQGVFNDNLLWLDPYSGPASSFWSTRSLVMFYYLSSFIDWGNIKPLALPSGKLEVDINVDAAKFRVITKPQESISIIEIETGQKLFNGINLKSMSFRDKLKGIIYACACRPSNNLQLMGVKKFDSRLSLYKKT